MKDIHDVITHAKFGDDRLRGLGVVAGQISAFPIDFAGRPYNTLTLPCDRVICLYFTTGHFHACVLCKECSLFAFLILGSVFFDCVVFYGHIIFILSTAIMLQIIL